MSLLPDVIKTNMLTEVHQIYYFVAKSQEFFKKCTDCSDIKDEQEKIDGEIQYQHDYATIIDHTIDEEYCDGSKSKVAEEKPSGNVSLDEHVYKSNLNVKNWFYGSSSQDKYKMDLFEITSNYNLTTCPRETPFTVNFSKTCFDCPKGMFNLGEQKCIFCEEGKFVNYTTGQCQDCFGELSYEFGIAFCRICEDEADTFLNQDTKKCQKCSAT